MEDNHIRQRISQKYCSYCGSEVSIKIPEGDNKERAVCKNVAVYFMRTQKLFQAVF